MEFIKHPDLRDIFLSIKFAIQVQTHKLFCNEEVFLFWKQGFAYILNLPKTIDIAKQPRYDDCTQIIYIDTITRVSKSLSLLMEAVQNKPLPTSNYLIAWEYWALIT